MSTEPNDQANLPAPEVTGTLHVFVAFDYEVWGVWVSDTESGTSRYYDWGPFMWMWNAMDGMGLAVGPY